MAYDWKDIAWMDDDDKPFVEAMMMEFQRTAMSKVGSDLQKKLIEICASKARGRPSGGGRGLLQFSAWLLLRGESHWSLDPKSKRKLGIGVSFANWDGAKLLKGHDTAASREDIELGSEVIKDLAHWFSTKYAVQLLLAYQKAQKKQLDGFLKMAKGHDPSRRLNRKEAGKWLNLAMLVRLNRAGTGIIGLQYGAAANGLISHVMMMSPN